MIIEAKANETKVKSIYSNTNRSSHNIVPLKQVLECMQDDDPIIASAGRAYYRQYYQN